MLSKVTDPKPVFFVCSIFELPSPKDSLALRNLCVLCASAFIRVCHRRSKVALSPHRPAGFNYAPVQGSGFDGWKFEVLFAVTVLVLDLLFSGL